MKFLARALAGSALLAAAPAAASQPVVTDIHWPHIDSYCTFWRKDHSFNFNDPESWRFVFFTQKDSLHEPYPETGFIALGHQLRQLELVSATKVETGEERRYRSLGASQHDVVVTMTAGEAGTESTGYTGTIAVAGPYGSETVAFQGDCGV